jgi:integrase/recombinase XerD
LQRYSGLRIGDCASLEKDRIDPLGRLFLYTAKSRTPVRLPLPPIVIESLNTFRHIGKAHYFWTGYSSLDTLTSNWRRTMRRLFELAELPGGHAHRFRDTFAVELLLAGTPIEEVSRLLGHRSIRVTEKHYSAWVRSRQERAEALVKTAWESDPLLNPTATAATKLLQKSKGA